MDAYTTMDHSNVRFFRILSRPLYNWLLHKRDKNGLTKALLSIRMIPKRVCTHKTHLPKFVKCTNFEPHLSSVTLKLAMVENDRENVPWLSFGLYMTWYFQNMARYCKQNDQRSDLNSSVTIHFPGVSQKLSKILRNLSHRYI